MANATIETKIAIAAPIERVWRVLTDLSNYPAWSRFILSVHGRPSEGATLSVELDDGGGKMRIRPLLLAFRPYELRWRGVLGASLLFSGEHSFRLEPLTDGGTSLTHGEVIGGLLVPLLWKRLDTRTRQGFNDFNAALRERCESVAP